MRNAIQGRCQCGQIKFSFAAQTVLTCYCCHCDQCRARTGAPFSFIAALPIHSFELNRTDFSQFQQHYHPPQKVTWSYHCIKCGTMIYGVSDRFPEVVMVNASVLETSGLEPVAHLWTKSALGWVKDHMELQGYETQPECFKVLVDLYRKK